MLVAIHQPNFFPWLGYFAKIARADKFIFLDDVQYPKTGGSWSNRVQLVQNKKPQWFSAPIERNYSGTRTVLEMQFSNQGNWREKLSRTLQANYARAPYFKAVMEIILPLLMNAENSLARYNMQAVRVIAAQLGLQHIEFLASSNFALSSTATGRLVELCQAVQGNEYLAGGGAAGYQQDDEFAAAQIALQYLNFKAMPYPQQGMVDFVPGLSVIDAVMNLGFAGVGNLLKDYRR